MTPVLAPAFSLILLLLAGAPLDLPLSLPPLPEDARLANVAPEKCLWYVALSGVAPVDPKSKNCVEQLLAEDDVKRFVREVSAKLKEAFAKASPNDPVRKLLGEESPKLLELLLTRPLCAYLEAIGPGPQGPTLRGGLVVSLDAQAVEIQASLEKLESTLLGLARLQANVSADGWHTLPLPKDAPQVQWGVQEKYLIVGIGENEAGAALGRLKNSKSAPQWLATARDWLEVERPSVVQYLNLEAILKMLDQPLAARVGGAERAAKILETLGVKNLHYYASVSGLEGDEYVSKTTLYTDGKPIGILSLLTGPALAAETFDSIPADATFAVAKRVDTEKGVDLLLQIVDALQPSGAPNPLTQAIDRFAATTGVNIKTDIVAALGDTWCAYNSPSDGGLVFTGLTITATLRDRDKLVAVSNRLVNLSKQVRDRNQQILAASGQPVAGSEITEFEYRGQKIFFLNFIGEGSPFAPAWCVTDKQAVFALFPQTIKAFLDQQATSISAKSAAPGSKGLGSVAAVHKQINGKAGPVVLVYQNTPALFELAYPFAQVSAQFACAELQKEGFDLNIGMLPNARSIAPHLIPSATRVRGTVRGLDIESHGSLPMGFGPLAILAVPFAIRSSVPSPHLDNNPFGNAPPTQLGVFPNIDLAPGFAEQSASINNLKQIAVAIINFVDIKKTLPAGAIMSKDGKPLLSWRVAILPFLEQNDLFAKFKLDEPWDSPHNKALIEKMPEVLKAPGSKAASEFKTVYLAVRGDNTAMPLDKPVKVRSITDGMSATIAVVEVADDKAVIWTKPDDFEPDEKNPIAGLVGLRDGVFLAAFCDAHVQAIPANVELESLKALFTRNGGEIVDLQNLKRQPVGAK